MYLDKDCFVGNEGLGCFLLRTNSPGIINKRWRMVGKVNDCQSSGKHNRLNQVIRLYARSESSAYKALAIKELVGAFPNG